MTPLVSIDRKENVQSTLMQWLKVTVILMPALLWGFVYRWREYTVSCGRPLSPDAEGFVYLANAEPYKYFTGWREPLWPFILHSADVLFGLDPASASYILSLVTSFLAIPVLFWVIYRLVGLLESVVATYLLAFSQTHVETLAFAAREDAMLIGLLILFYFFARRRFCVAFLLAGVLVHLRVSTLVFAVLFYLTLLASELLPLKPRYYHQYFKQYHTTKDWACLVIGLAFASPVLLYFQLNFGDPLAPQTIAVHEYFYEEKYGKWLTNVTQNFSQAAMPDENLVGPMLLENNFARLVQATKSLFLWKMLEYISTSAPVLLGVVVGFVISCFKKATLPLALFFLINTLPLLSISWSEHFRSGLALVSGVTAMVFLSITFGAIVRIIMNFDKARREDLSHS